MIAGPLKWHGGKSYLARWIISHFPAHLHYVEPYFGGGAVLLQKPCDGVSEVVNDIYGELVNFWLVLRDREMFDQLVRLCEATPFSEAVFHDADLANGDPVTAAWRFFVRARQSRQGLMKDFATLTRNRTRRGMNEQASAWLGAIEGLPAVHERLKRVVILCRPALEVIQQQDGENTLFYLDPPYLHEARRTTDAYRFEMSREDHRELLVVLAGIRGKFVLSGYPSSLYDDFASQAGWARRSKTIDNKASSGKTKERKEEVIWMNYEPPPALEAGEGVEAG